MGPGPRAGCGRSEASMDFNFSAEDEGFRHELRTWLEANVPKDLKPRGDIDMLHEEAPDDWKLRLQFHRKMHAAGWVGISWPKEYGGRGASLMQQIIYNEEMAHAG